MKNIVKHLCYLLTILCFISTSNVYANEEDSLSTPKVGDIWLTGIRFPVNFSWKQRRANKSFTSTRRHLTITLTGVLDTYIIVNGIGKILSQNRTYSFNFQLKS